MKKLYIIILLVLLSLISPEAIMAQYPSNSNYDLPYPGILPDNPTYIIKTIRDNISQLFISDPISKAEFNANLADARMSAALVLAEQKNNIPLASDTLSDAGDFFQQALDNANVAKAQGIEVSQIMDRLSHAGLKYREIINIIEEKTDTKDKEKIDAIKKTLTTSVK